MEFKSPEAEEEEEGSGYCRSPGLAHAAKCMSRCQNRGEEDRACYEAGVLAIPEVQSRALFLSYEGGKVLGW